MRSKENAQDYRYFPDPDLLPCYISQEWIQELRSSLPELIDEKKQRYRTEYDLPALDIDFLTAEKKTADLFESALSFGCPPKEASNWIMGDLMKMMKDRQLEIDEMQLDAKPFARMIQLQLEGKINRNAARQILSEILERPVDPDEYVREHHLEMVTDTSGIRQCILEILSTNVQSVADYKSGKEKAFSFLVGQVMRQMKGKADPTAVHSILKEEMEKNS